ncbi:MAG: elements of external origin [Alphaproteobacteria bacterium]
MGVSIRAYARHRGVSHVAVLRAAKEGRIPLEADGTVDPAKADAAWEAGTDPAQARPARTSRSRARPAAEPPVREAPREQALPGTGVNFVQARTAREIAMAHLARQKLQERRGEVTDRARATALVFRLAREERDAWVTWPARVAAVMAAEIGTGAHALQTALERHVRAHLAELAEVRPEFR